MDIGRFSRYLFKNETILTIVDNCDNNIRIAFTDKRCLIENVDEDFGFKGHNYLIYSYYSLGDANNLVVIYPSYEFEKNCFSNVIKWFKENRGDTPYYLKNNKDKYTQVLLKYGNKIKYTDTELIPEIYFNFICDCLTIKKMLEEIRQTKIIMFIVMLVLVLFVK